MSLSKIRSALVKGFVDAAIDLPFASENSAFTPPEAAAWAEVFYVPGTPVMATIGAGGMDTVEGYLQVNINVPLNSGTALCMTKADALRSYFPGGKVFTHQGQEVRIKTAGTKPGFNSTNSFKTPTLIEFYAQIPRNS